MTGNRYQLGDTIAAIATPAGEGGVGIVRLSGPQSLVIARDICGGRSATPWRPRHAYLRRFLGYHGQVLDHGIVLYFPAPNSFTGEDVVELQGHGSPVVLHLLLQRAIGLGARLARPGEFSERAFLNRRMDLAQAEAIADLIHARSEAQARAAIASMEGQFSSAVTSLRSAILQALALAEASLDFSEEDLGGSHREILHQALQALRLQTEEILRPCRAGARLSHGARVVLAGRPNVGKSSLLNALAQRESAIVTPVPGTTRDILREEILVDGLPVELLDTAGLHDDTDDLVEQEGIRRSRAAMESAQWILLLADARAGWLPADQEILAGLDSRRCTIVWNKVDLVEQSPCLSSCCAQISVSARTGHGLEQLEQHLSASLGGAPQEGSVFSARTRHLQALQECHDALLAGDRLLEHSGPEELLAQSLREAAHALSRVTGEMGVEEILGEIFSRFCIGK